MGNQNSASLIENKNHKELQMTVNKIAKKYILTQTFKDMESLGNNLKDTNSSCDKITIFTKDILDEFLNDRQVEYLYQQTHDGKEVNVIQNDKLVYIHDDSIKKVKEKKSKLMKKRMCIGIAKYYVDIARIFAAISKTINIDFTYTTISGEVEEKPFYENTESQDNTLSSKKKYSNFCERKLQNILNVIVRENNNVEGERNKNSVRIKVGLCENKNVHFLDKNVENGIKELENLYYDKYNYSDGMYTDRSPRQEKKYKEDIKKIYTLFYNTTPSSKSIEKFSDIKLPTLSKGICGSNESIEVSTKDKQYQAFINSIKNYYKVQYKIKDKLLKILLKIFAIRKTKNGEEEIILHPTLNDNTLQLLKETTQIHVLEYYMQCETQYQNILEAYEALLIHIRVNTIDSRERENQAEQFKSETFDELDEEVKKDDKIHPAAITIKGDHEINKDKAHPASISSFTTKPDSDSSSSTSNSSKCKDKYKIQFHRDEHEGDEKEGIHYSGFYAINNALQYNAIHFNNYMINEHIWDESDKTIKQIEINEFLTKIQMEANANGITSNNYLSYYVEKLKTKGIPISEELIQRVKSADADTYISSNTPRFMIELLLKELLLTTKCFTNEFKLFNESNAKELIYNSNKIKGVIILQNETNHYYFSLKPLSEEERKMCNPSYTYIMFDSKNNRKTLLTNTDLESTYMTQNELEKKYKLSSDPDKRKKVIDRFKRLHLKLYNKMHMVIHEKNEYPDL